MKQKCCKVFQSSTAMTLGLLPELREMIRSARQTVAR